MAKKKLRNGFVLIWLTLFSLQTQISSQAQVSDQQEVDGGANVYFNSDTGEQVVPEIEIRDGKKYYTWPMWNRSKTVNYRCFESALHIPMRNGGQRRGSGFSCIGGL